MPHHLTTLPGDADWSDFALWWPDKAIWLNKPRQTLYAYGIMSDAKLEFVPVHRYISIEMPNRQRYQMRVNFAIMTFFTVGEICREFNVRHPEEMSLMRSPLDKENFAKLTGWNKRRKVREGEGRREGRGKEGGREGGRKRKRGGWGEGRRKGKREKLGRGEGEIEEGRWRKKEEEKRKECSEEGMGRERERRKGNNMRG